MDIFRIIGIGIVGMVLAVLIKNYRPEIAIQISIAAAAIIFLITAPYLKSVLIMFEEIADQVGINTLHMGIVLKVIGAAYITQFAAELCKDAGESAIASKIEFAGKVVIMMMSMPIVYSVLNLVNDMVNF